MMPVIRRLSALFLCAAAAAALPAQRTDLSIVGGVFQTPYRFADRTLYPNTSFTFPWSGDYAQASGLLGVDLSRAFSPHWRIETGLRLFLTGYAQEKDLHWPSEVSSNGTYTAALPIDRLAIHHLFLEIPLLTRYLFSTGAWTPYLEAGILTDYYLTSGVKERLEGHTNKFRDRNDAVRPLHFALHLGAGMQYQYSGRQAAFLQAVVSRRLNSIENGSENPGIGFGLHAGWRLRIKS